MVEASLSSCGGGVRTTTHKSAVDLNLPFESAGPEAFRVCLFRQFSATFMNNQPRSVSHDACSNAQYCGQARQAQCILPGAGMLLHHSTLSCERIDTDESQRLIRTRSANTTGIEMSVMSAMIENGRLKNRTIH